MKPSDLDDDAPIEPNEELLARVHARSRAFRLRRSSRRLASVVNGLLILVLAVGIAWTRIDNTGSPATGPAPSATTTTTVPHDGLRAAALAWSKAFLTGTPADITTMEGPQCAPNSSTTFSERIVTMYLQTEREQLRRHFGVALSAIKIRGILVRNVTKTSGEAEVQYDLPESATGNANWVTYENHKGRWKVGDCHAPIGGSSASSSGSVP